MCVYIVNNGYNPGYIEAMLIKSNKTIPSMKTYDTRMYFGPINNDCLHRANRRYVVDDELTSGRG